MVKKYMPETQKRGNGTLMDHFSFLKNLLLQLRSFLIGWVYRRLEEGKRPPPTPTLTPAR